MKLSDFTTESFKHLGHTGATTINGTLTVSNQIMTTQESANSLKSRFLMGKDTGNTNDGDLYINYGTSHDVYIGAGGGSSNLTVSNDGFFNGTKLEGDSKEMIRFNDSWLRLNPANEFTNGIYAGTGIFRTDGTFQVGSSGSKFSVNGSTGNVVVAGSHTANSLNSTSGDISLNGEKFVRQKTYSCTGNIGTSGSYYTLGYITESNTPSYITLKTAAHSTQTFVVTTGYHGSNVAHVQMLSSTWTPNGGYPHVAAVRILKDSSNNYRFQVKLTYSSGPVGFELYARSFGATNKADVVQFQSSLTVDTTTGTTIEELETGFTGSANSGQNRSDYGSVSAPIYSFKEDSDTGVYRQGANSLGLVAGGVERLRIQSDVSVLGATDLHIAGSNRRLSFTSGTGTIRTTNATSLILQTGSTTALTLDSSQNATFAGTIGSGNIEVGASDTTNGTITIHGGASGNSEGGEIRLQTSADHDSTYDFYRLDVIQDDFRIGRQGQTDFYIFQDGLVKAENNFQAGGTGSFGNVVSALAYQVSGTEVIDSSRNLKNIGAITSGNINIEAASPQLLIEDTNNAGGGAASGALKFSNTSGVAMAIGYTSNVTSDSDMIITTNSSGTYGGYLGLAANAITDPIADIILEPKTNLYVATGNIGVGTKSPLGHVNTNSSFFRPDTNGKFITLSSGHGGFINLQSTSTTDSDQMGGVFFTRTAGQADAHKQIAGIDAIQEANTGSSSLDGGRLRFFTKPNNSGTNTPRMQIDQNGNIFIGTTAIIDQSRNFTNIGTISSTHFQTLANVNSSGSGGVFIPNGKRIGFDQTGTRSWTQYAAGGNLLFASGDGNGAVQANNFTASVSYKVGTTTVIDSSRNLSNIGTISSGKITATSSNDQSTTGCLNLNTTGTSLRLGGNTNYSWIQSHLSKPLYINELGNNVIFNSAGGQVGIGTTSPSAKLHVQGGTGTGTHTHAKFGGTAGREMLIRTRSDLAGGQHSGCVEIFSSDTEGDGGEIALTNNGGVRLFIDGDGDTGIGTTDPSHRLHVNAGTTNIVARFESTDTAAILQIKDSTGVAAIESRNDFRFKVSTSTENMRLTTGGALHVEGDVTAFSTTVSDKKLKDDVKTIDGALDKVLKLRGVEYTWNETSKKGQKDLGVIAQEVEEVLPEIVQEKEMVLLDEKVYKTVDYEKLTAVLIEAVKEQQKEIEKLKEKVNSKSL